MTRYAARVIPWIVIAVVVVPLVIAGFLATVGRRSPENIPKVKTRQARARTEQEFAEAEVTRRSGVKRTRRGTARSASPSQVTSAGTKPPATSGKRLRDPLAPSPAAEELTKRCGGQASLMGWRREGRGSWGTPRAFPALLHPLIYGSRRVPAQSDVPVKWVCRHQTCLQNRAFGSVEAGTGQGAPTRAHVCAFEATRQDRVPFPVGVPLHCPVVALLRSRHDPPGNAGHGELAKNPRNPGGWAAPPPPLLPIESRRQGPRSRSGRQHGRRHRTSGRARSLQVVDRVAGLVVAGVVRLTGGAAVDRGLLRRLDALGAGEQAAGRDAVAMNGP